MRIALLCRSLPWHRTGGLEWHTWDLARGLAERGHEIFLITTPTPDAEARDRFLGGFSSGGLGVPPKSSNPPPARAALRLIECGAQKNGRYSVSYLREAAAHCRRLAARAQIDLVHAQGFAAFLLPERTRLGVPFVVTIHGTLWSETWMDARARHLLGFRERLLLPARYAHRLAAAPLYARMLKRANCLVVDSEFTRGELTREYPGIEAKIRVVPLGVDVSRFIQAGRPAQPSAAPTSASSIVRLLLLGRIERGKGFDVVLQALASLKGEGPAPGAAAGVGANWTLDIAGGGPDRARIEALAANLGISDRVRMLGRVADDQLAGVFAGADLFLNPDLTQPAFGLVTLEAMLQGTPVLASRAGALPEVVGREGGWLAPAGDCAAWARRLRRLIARPELLRRKGESARRRALECFSIEGMLDGVEEAWRSALGIDPASPRR